MMTSAVKRRYKALFHAPCACAHSLQVFEEQPVRHEFLHDVARQTCLELEEIVFQPFHRHNDPLDSLLNGLANQIQGFPFASQFLSVWRADEHLHTLNKGKGYKRAA